MQPGRPGRIFVSYRRDGDNQPGTSLALRLKKSLDTVFGAEAAFVDTQSIQTGDQWPERIRTAVENAAAVVVVITDHWLRAGDKWGCRFLDADHDWCRLEIEWAIEKRVRLFPVLVDGQEMPPARALPKSIAALADRNAQAWSEDFVEAQRDLVEALRPVLEASDQPASAGVIEAYCDYLADTHQRFVSFFPDADQHELADVYVDLHVGVATNQGDDEVSQRRRNELGQSRRALLRDLLREPVDEVGTHALVLLGEPGAGKSTVARQLVLQVATELRDRAQAFGEVEGDAIPVYLPLAALAAEDARHPFAAIERAMRGHRDEAAAEGLCERLFEIAEGRRPGWVWLLLDGLDEVSPAQVTDLRRKLLAWADSQKNAKLRIVVCSRAIGYAPLGHPYRVARLERLDSEGRELLLSRWLGPSRARSLADRVAAQPELEKLMTNPLLLTLLARLSREHSVLPEDRTTLYRRAVDLLLRTPYDSRTPIRAPNDVLRVLGDLALELQDDPGAAWSLETLNERLWGARKRSEYSERVLTSSWASDNEAFLRDVERKTGILASDPATATSWVFLHRQFREYLAAFGLTRSGVPWQDRVPVLNHESLPRWSESLGIYCGMVAAPFDVLSQLRDQNPQAAIKALSEVDGPAAEELFEFVWSVPSEIEDWTWSEEEPSRYRWDGDDLLQLVQAWIRRGRWDVRRAREALLGRASKQVPVFELAWCFYALRVLGEFDEGAFFEQIGRPMPDSAEFDWVSIPAGEFEMGSPEDEPERYDDEGPQHEVRVPEFGLLRCAVTNAQYARFDPGHEAERFDGKVKDPSEHPVVNVDWWGAYLFSAWIGGRLPSEAEWEYGCRAGTRGPFSMDGELSSERVNYDGNHPYAGAPEGKFRECTVPVGELPANGWGLQEMHGNVWEWCQDRWQESYEGAPVNGSAWEVGGSGNRVVRGGSWIYDGGGCRSAARGRFAPGFRYGFVGFRPARSH